MEMDSRSVRSIVSHLPTACTCQAHWAHLLHQHKPTRSSAPPSWPANRFAGARIDLLAVAVVVVVSVAVLHFHRGAA